MNLPVFSSYEDRATDEALRWLARQQNRLSTAEQKQFEAWLLADRRHQSAYAHAAETWDEIGELTHLGALASAHLGKRSAPAFGRGGRWIVGGAVAALAAIMLVLAPVLPVTVWPQAAPHYETAVGRIEPVRLEDGSVVTLGARSAIDTDFSDIALREVTLREGQAYFEVAHNVERPFFVRAGDVSIEVVGTKFDVRRGPDLTVVSVREGAVRVRDAGGVERLLHAGEQAIVERRTSFLFVRLSETHVGSVAPASVAAWTEGRLVYDDAPLSELMADLNRYYSPGIHVGPGIAGDVRVTASFTTGEIESFLEELDDVVPVRSERDADGRYRIDRVRER